RSALNISRIDRAPTIADFKDLESASDLAGKMSHVNGFTANDPTDGARPTQQTDVYLGYDPANIYVVFLCHDTNPGAIRAQMAKRETVFSDDWVEITFDTYKDKRRGFTFASNPLGIQSEGLWTEDNGADWSWDT